MDRALFYGQKMKIQTSKLSCAQLDLAHALIDPQCSELKWEFRYGVMCGIIKDGLEYAGQIVLFIPSKAMGFVQRTMLARRIDASVYSPTKEPGSAMKLAQTKGISTDNWQAPRWAAGFVIPAKHPDAKISPSHCRQLGATPMEAIVRCIVFAHYGDFVEIPDELANE